MNTPKLGRKTDNRNRTLRNLVTSLFLYEKIRTTEAKAKAMRPMAERLMTLSRSENSLEARRRAKALLFDSNAVAKIFEDILPRAGARTSGFIRITKLPVRPGDGSPMAQVELLLTPVEEMIEKETKTKVSVRKAKTTEVPV